MIWIIAVLVILVIFLMLAFIGNKEKELVAAKKRIKRLTDASMLIAVAASRDIREYDASLITEDRRKRGDDTSIMVVARVSVWREFIAAIKGE